MLPATLTQFRSLRPPVRSLVLLYWIYTFTSSLTWVFTQIFLYSRFQSLTLNTVSSLLLFTGIMVGFCVFGYFASVLRLNIKYGFFLSFLIFAIGFITLLYATTAPIAYLSVFLNGLGNGFFWLTIHTFELVETRDRERDYYSSLLSAGDQFFSFVGPACATGLIWISQTLLQLGTFTLLFAVTPVIYLLGFFFFSSLREYRPKPITWDDVTHFFSDRRNQTFQMFVMGEGLEHILRPIIVPLVSLAILGTALTVGLYSTLAGAFSVLCILMIARRRTAENRLMILTVATIILVAAMVWLGFTFTLAALIIFTVVQSIAAPLIGVSNHVISLQGMESMGRSTSDFYATMILRDFSLWVWRTTFGLIFLSIVLRLDSTKTALPLGIYLIAFSLLITLFGAKLVVSGQKTMPAPALDTPPSTITG